MTIKSVGVIGAGTMGSGIAINIAQYGIPVRLVDRTDERVAAARRKAVGFFEKQAERGRMKADEAAASGARIQGGVALEPLADCDLAIEAVFERFDIKAELYAKLAPILRPEALLATNTSCLRVSGLAEEVEKPERFLGLHYFNPPAINPIVEVVRGDKTDPAAVDAALAFCRATGKKTVACRDSYGFALNRFFCPYVNEAIRLYDEGVGSPFEIDRVACDVVGAAAGPFVVANLVGAQVLMHAQENLTPLGAFYRPADSVMRMGKDGGAWEIGDPSASDPSRDEKIGARLMGATFLPVLQALDEEVALPAEIDMGAEAALKFGKPPCRLMDSLGREEVERLIAPFCSDYGAPAPGSVRRVGRLVG